MNKTVHEFLNETKLAEDLIYKNAAEEQEMLVRDVIAHLLKTPIFAVSTYTSKSCLLPVYGFYMHNGMRVIMRDNFHGWVVSVKSPFPFTIDCPLIDAWEELKSIYSEGFKKEWCYSNKTTDTTEVTFSVRSRYDIYTVLYLLNRIENPNPDTEKRTMTDEEIDNTIRTALANHPLLRIHNIFTKSYVASDEYDFRHEHHLEFLCDKKCYPDETAEYIRRVKEYPRIREIFIEEWTMFEKGENIE